MNTKFIIQLFKYGVVGVMNTCVTVGVIGSMMYFLFQVHGGKEATPVAVSVSNMAGYVAGFINSFVWNRKWTFHSRKSWKTDLLRFLGAFLICYIPQLLLVMALNNYVTLPPIDFRFYGTEYIVTSAYLCQLIGIVFYTSLNFLCNKYYTFKA
jgi:putative flippase GtrA